MMVCGGKVRRREERGDRQARELPCHAAVQ